MSLKSIQYPTGWGGGRFFFNTQLFQLRSLNWTSVFQYLYIRHIRNTVLNAEKIKNFSATFSRWQTLIKLNLWITLERNRLSIRSGFPLRKYDQFFRWPEHSWTRNAAATYDSSAGLFFYSLRFPNDLVNQCSTSFITKKLHIFHSTNHSFYL